MKPRLVLIGVGRFGHNHLRVLMQLDKEKKCELVGVVDSKSDILVPIAKKNNIKTSTTVDKFVKDADALILVTPTDTHFNLSKKFLNAGKHVFVEKPLAKNYIEAKKLQSLAIEKRKILMVGHIFRYNSAVRKIKELIDNNQLGKIFYLSGHFTGLKDPRTDAGALFSYNVHHIDLYNYFLGSMPEEVTCSTGYFLGRKELDDVAIITLKYPSGTLGIIEGSWLPPGKQRDLTIVGSKASIISDLLSQKLHLHDLRIEKKEKHFKAIDKGSVEIELQFKEPLELELLDFISSIKTGQKPVSDGQAGVNSINVMENALKSANLGRTMRLKP